MIAWNLQSTILVRWQEFILALQRLRLLAGDPAERLKSTSANLICSQLISRHFARCMVTVTSSVSRPLMWYCAEFRSRSLLVAAVAFELFDLDMDRQVSVHDMATVLQHAAH